MTGSKNLEDPEGGLVAYEKLKDRIGRPRTLSLFWEHRLPDYVAPYTLKDYDHEGCMSMYQKYMEYSDPTEYSVALGLLGSWKHWQTLCAAPWFKPYIEQWRGELKQKLAYERFLEMAEAATKKKDLRATKWLDEKYGIKAPSKRGRPSKAEQAQLKEEYKEEQSMIKEEAERLGL